MPRTDLQMGEAIGQHRKKLGPVPGECFRVIAPEQAGNQKPVHVFFHHVRSRINITHGFIERRSLIASMATEMQFRFQNHVFAEVTIAFAYVIEGAEVPLRDADYGSCGILNINHHVWRLVSQTCRNESFMLRPDGQLSFDDMKQARTGRQVQISDRLITNDGLRSGHIIFPYFHNLLD